eukprot:356636-Chlamydomonas_euryale.AAC.3
MLTAVSFPRLSSARQPSLPLLIHPPLSSLVIIWDDHTSSLPLAQPGAAAATCSHVCLAPPPLRKLPLIFLHPLAHPGAAAAICERCAR